MPPKKKSDGGEPPSRQHTKCGYCDVRMRRDRLREHTNEFHPGQPKMEAGHKSFSIKDMFARASTKRKASDSQLDQDSDAAKRLKKQNASSSSAEICDVDEGRDKPIDHEEMEIVDMAVQESDGISQVDESGQTNASRPSVSDKSETTGTGRPTTSSSSCGTASNVEAKLDSVLKALDDLKISVQSSVRPKEQKAKLANGKDETKTETTEALKILVQNSKCLRRVCDLAEMTASDDFVTCDVCCADIAGEETRKNGVFRYDFTLGTDFTESTQPQEFRNLKKNIARHLETQTHITNLMVKEQITEELRKQQSKEQGVGVTVGKQAYRILKYGRPFTDFEVDMTLLSSAKVNVGNLNHSRKFASELRPAFAEAINTRIKSYLSEPLAATSNIPPIGIVADKVTTRRRTTQMYGGVVFTPCMPSLLTPISFGLHPVKGHDGESIATDIIDLCKIYDIKNSQIAGFGFDGQYFHLNVDSKLKTKMHLDDKVGFSWDPAHKLQLADKDTRKDEDWIDGICSDISAVLNKFAFGKTFEAALEKAHELGIDMKAPLWFSDTRFAAFAHMVFNNFINNYEIVRRVLEDIAASNTPRAKEADDLLRRINKVDFVGKTLILIDYYKHLSEVSQILQKVDHPVWSKANAVHEYIELLRTWDDSRYQSFVHYQADLASCQFKNLPLLRNPTSLMIPLRRTRQLAANEEVEDDDDNGHDTSLVGLKSKGTALAASMQLHMNERFTQAYFDDIEQKQKAASLLPVLKLARTTIGESDLLESPEVQTLLQMHPTHAEGVRNLCLNIARNADTLSDCNTDFQMYHKIYSVNNLYVGAEHILSEIAKIICSSPPESIVESMGSVIEKIRQVRGGSKTSTNRKDVQDINDELVIHWNGPPINKCESIVRQALNIHFKGSRWHFIAKDVRAQLHRVSVVVDRINKTQSTLTFMN